ncbi:major capsid pentamer protein [Gordonia phage AnClar]|nr:major capsid pentamer protein [Gordonia phage AnClar]
MTAPAPATPGINAVDYDAPLVNPSPAGLYSAVTWVEDGVAVPRWLAGGVRVLVHNFGGDDAFGVWTAEWCGDPGDNLKDGTRPAKPEPFDPLTVWAYDQCDLRSQSQTDTRVRAQQNLRMREQIAVEREFAGRLLADAPAPAQVGDVIAAVSHLEAQLAKTNTTGVIHASAGAAAIAASENLIVRQGGALRTPLGHLWAFGGGYVDGLGTSLVATSPVFGWRDEASLRDTVEARYNQFVAVAERSVVIGYESAVAAATLT